jgi:nondiscriminating aspartyl-tRNA synthetase
MFMDLKKRTYTSKAKGKKSVLLAGWVKDIRSFGKLRFIILRDKTGTAQITIFKEKSEKLFSETDGITKESVIAVEGEVKKNPKAPNGFEVIPKSIEIISLADSPVPIDISGKIESSIDKRIDWRFIDMRMTDEKSKMSGIDIFSLQSDLIKNLCDFMYSRGFTRIFTSKIVDAPTEGGADFFKIEYFDKDGYLAQSPQFYKESVLASGVDRVFEISQVYRAEPHFTTRHLCEYASFDLEMAFIDGMEDVMKMQEDLLRYAFKQMKFSFPKKIPSITFKDAVEMLKKKGIAEENDLTPEGERFLCEWSKKKYDSEFIFVTGFPWKAKPFYVMKDGEYSKSFDLLYKGIEITTGGQREHRYKQRVKNCEEKDLRPDDFDHLRFFRYGMPPHGGLGMGIERLTQMMLNLNNIRESTLLPRDPLRLTP